MFRSKKAVIVGLSLAASVVLLHAASQYGLFDVKMSPSIASFWLRKSETWANTLVPSSEMYHGTLRTHANTNTNSPLVRNQLSWQERNESP